MKLLLIRHAPAELRESFDPSGGNDRDRPLTDRGRRRMRRAAQALPRLLPGIDLLFTSPLLRSTQTAAIVADAYGAPEPIEITDLEPGRRPWELADWLSTQDPAHTVVVVGHEPGLSEAITWFLSGLARSFVAMKKGAACLLEFPHQVKGGGATLCWALQPGQLR